MGMIESFLEYNEKFVAEKQYEKYQTSKYRTAMWLLWLVWTHG